MKHPNAFAALIAGAATAGIQWALARYLNTELDREWSQTINLGVTAAVLWVGREGIRGAIVRVWRGAKAVWAGTTPPAS